MNNIDLSELEEIQDAETTGGWTPIGTNSFTGVFDGGDFTISGLVINIEDSSTSEEDVCAGLFGYVGSGGVVKNVKVEGAEIDVTVTGNARTYAGIIAGRCAGDISGCTSSGSVNVTAAATYRVGGIAGYIHGNVNVTGCTNTASIRVTETGNSNKYANVGGIAGYAENVINIINCKNGGTVTGGASSSAGGIAGYFYYYWDSMVNDYAYNAVTLNGCENSGEVTGNLAGGIAGQIRNYVNEAALVRLTNCTNSGNVNEIGNSSMVGGFVGYVDYASVVDIVNSSTQGTVEGATCGGIAGCLDSSAKITADSATTWDKASNPTLTEIGYPSNYTTGATAQEQLMYKITAAAGVGGTITPNDECPVMEGESQTFTITANEGYVIDHLLIDGTANTDLSGQSTGAYTFSDVRGAHTIEAYFRLDGSTPPDTDPEPTPTTYTITTTASEGGTISPSGELSVTEGEKQTFTVKANEGYVIEAVTADGQAIAEAAGKTEYTFEITVTKSQTVSATFKLSGGTTPDDDVTGEVTASGGSTITDMSSTNLSDEESKNAMANASQSGENITPLGAFTLNVTHNGGPAEFVVHLHKELTFTGTPVVIIERKDKSAYTIFDATYANKTISFSVDRLEDYFSSNTVVIADKTSAPGGGGGGGCSAGFGALALLAIAPLALKRRK